MRHRLSATLLAALILLPALPVTAVEPSPEPSPAPTVEPAPTVDPTPAPTLAPSPSSARSGPLPSVDPPPTVDPAPASEPAPVVSHAKDGGLDATGRYIVVMKTGADTARTVDRLQARDGLHADRTFANAFHGFTAKLGARELADLRANPDVASIIPDEIVHITAQTVPTGVSRIGAKSSTVAQIDGTDQRVDADVAIVDTGVGPHADLNIAGGYNCSSSNRAAWADNNGHGTHVAGTVAALDNTFGVVGVAPGARIWAVKILNGDGYGYLSWYVCGLDWILSRRDPNDSSKPLIEAVNMSVAKSGADDSNCGNTNKDILHQAICRLVAGGVTVVAAAANDHASASHRVPAAYNEVITVSALADTDGKPGGLGGDRCFSWGTYDKDDTFADFSNYGFDVDLIAPGKCIWSTRPNNAYAYSSGTSMAAPAVTGAVALYKSSRPNATPSQVKEALQYLGTYDWKVSTDPDSHHEKLLDVSRLGPLGTFTVAATAPAALGEAGGQVSIPVTLIRSATFFERTYLTVSGVPTGWTAAFSQASLLGWTANTTTLLVSAPRPVVAGTYPLTVTAMNQGRTQTTTVTVTVENDLPTARAAKASLASAGELSRTTVPITLSWAAATDPTSPIGGYEVQMRVQGGTWGAVSSTSASVRSLVRSIAPGVAYDVQIRARDTVGNWSPWVQSALGFTAALIDDRRSAVHYGPTWTRTTSTAAIAGTLHRAATPGSTISYTFTGRGISVIAPLGPGRAKFSIRIDGVLVKTVSLRTNLSHARRIVFATTFASSGRHHITLQMVGSGKVHLDAFVIAQ